MISCWFALFLMLACNRSICCLKVLTRSIRLKAAASYLMFTGLIPKLLSPRMSYMILSTRTRHSGHVGCFLSQSSMQLKWNSCLHGRRASCGRVIDSRQMEQCDSAWPFVSDDMTSKVNESMIIILATALWTAILIVAPDHKRQSGGD